MPITYDAIGNPLSIGDKTLTWRNGRELASYADSTNTISYVYNNDGIRTSKTVNNVTTNYYLKGNKIVFEEKNNTVLYFIYNNDELVGFKYNGNTYHYHKNQFGDVIGIYDSNNNEIVTYEYDSWGVPISVIDTSNVGLATINPFRYRSYYYDEETKLYYLNLRYYNPIFRRFISIDSYVSTGQKDLGYNMYSYCANNPINSIDSCGKLWKKLKKFVSSIGNSLKKIAKKVFGAESSSSTTIFNIGEQNNERFGPLTYSTGMYTTISATKKGDSSKMISVYANKSLDNPIISSSVGININVSNFRYNLNLSLDDLGGKLSYLGNDYVSTFGTRVNLSEFKIGYEYTNTVSIDKKTTETMYYNGSADGWFIAAVCIFLATGVPIPEVGGMLVPAFA